jgi:hypothetical protein
MTDTAQLLAAALQAIPPYIPKRMNLYRKRCRWLDKPLSIKTLKASRRRQLAIVASLF